MNLRITEEHNEYRLAGTLQHMDTGAGVCTIELYATDMPASIYDAPGASPLVIMLLDDPSGVVDSGMLTLIPGDDQLVLVSGVAKWGRCRNGNGTTSWDADASDTAGSGVIKLPSTTLYAGGVTRIVSAILV